MEEVRHKQNPVSLRLKKVVVQEEVRQREQVQPHNQNAREMKQQLREIRRPCTRAHQ